MSYTMALRQEFPAPHQAAVLPFNARPVERARPAAGCESCCLRKECLPGGLAEGDIHLFDELVSTKRKVARGAALFRAGDGFEALYSVHSGAFKTLVPSRHGNEKITGFHLQGELIGLDAISNSRHGGTAIALEDSEVCVLPFARLEAAALRIPAIQHRLLRALSSDISRDHGLMLLLGAMTAGQRLAAFLLSLSHRYARMGYASGRFALRMTREEIGSYLGLTLETVSRLFSRFQREGLLAVQQRDIEIRNTGRLMEMVGR